MNHVQFNGQNVYSLSPEDLFLLKDEMPAGTVEQDIKRRIAWVIEHKCEERWKQFREYWTSILLREKQEFPSDKKDFVNLVVSRIDYQDRDARDSEHQANTEAKAQVQ